MTAAAAPRRRFPAVSGCREESTVVYAGPGWVGGRLRQVESRRSDDGYLLRVEGVGEFSVSADGGEIAWLRRAGSRSLDEEEVAAVLGPCLPLALALRGTWCLHASAAGTGPSAVALIGESGAGKSTLAAALAAQAAAWRRVGDDLLPIRLAGRAALALPRFPQPRLPADLQWRPPAPGEMDLTAVYLLEPGGDAVEIRSLSRREAALALVRNTVAARLFDADLQARHLDACADLVRYLPVCALRFPRRPEALPSMTAAIVAGLG